MEPSSPRWLSDLVKDDMSISFPHQYEMMLHSLEDYTLNDLNFHSAPTTTTQSDIQTQAKQIQKFSSNSPTSKIISFGGITDHICTGDVKPKKEEAVSSKKLVQSSNSDYYQTADTTVGVMSSSFGRGNYKGKQVSSEGLSIRRPFYAKEHVVAERKRREKISQQFIALSAVLPELKKMDKASVLGEAAKYVKHLQERIKKLEAEVAKKSTVLVKKSHVVSADDDSSSSDETSGDQTFDKQLPEIEARVSQKHILIRVHCERRPSCTAKILDLIEKMNLSILSNSVISFGSSLLDITIVAQMEVEFDMTIDELVKKLRQDFMNFM